MELQSCPAITLSPGGIFWDRVISEARYRFCRQGVFFFFFLILYYIFWLQIALSFMYFATMYFYHSLYTVTATQITDNIGFL